MMYFVNDKQVLKIKTKRHHFVHESAEFLGKTGTADSHVILGL